MQNFSTIYTIRIKLGDDCISCLVVWQNFIFKTDTPFSYSETNEQNIWYTKPNSSNDETKNCEYLNRQQIQKVEVREIRKDNQHPHAILRQRRHTHTHSDQHFFRTFFRRTCTRQLLECASVCLRLRHIWTIALYCNEFSKWRLPVVSSQQRISMFSVLVWVHFWRRHTPWATVCDKIKLYSALFIW